ncbi:MAG: hypothetical protein ISS77_05520 [Phycisphaerae bacterium]|nr:hypothetical protein [Phycisphaerae bacterium]
MKKYWIVGTVGICITAVSLVFAQTQDIDLLWKARALQAVEKMEVLTKKMEKEDSQTLRYEIMLEFAYANILTMPDTLIKKDSLVTSYHIFLNYGDDGLFNLLYNYSDETNNLVSVSIDHLPKNRRIVMYHDTPNAFFLINPSDMNEPMIAFSKTKPFEAFVVGESMPLKKK